MVDIIDNEKYPVFYNNTETLIIPESMYKEITYHHTHLFISIPGGHLAITINDLNPVYHHDQDNMSYYEIKHEEITRLLKNREGKEAKFITNYGTKEIEGIIVF